MFPALQELAVQREAYYLHIYIVRCSKCQSKTQETKPILLRYGKNVSEGVTLGFRGIIMMEKEKTNTLCRRSSIYWNKESDIFGEK